MVASNRTAYIYALKDPITLEIRYIGRTVSLKDRYSDHINEIKKPKYTHKINWIRFLSKKGFKPIMIVLEKTIVSEYIKKEQEWIIAYKYANLTNSTAGGDGLIDPSPEIRKKMSDAQKKHWASLSQKNRQLKISKILEITHTKENIAKIRKSLLGRHLTENCKAKISASLTGRTPGMDTRRKLSAASLIRMALIPESTKKLRCSLISRGVKRGTSSKFHGVGYSVSRKKWTASLTDEFGKNKFLGRFDDEISAAKEYDRVTKKINNTPLNFPESSNF